MDGLSYITLLKGSGYRAWTRAVQSEVVRRRKGMCKFRAYYRFGETNAFRWGVGVLCGFVVGVAVAAMS